jgi:hypothetical protein
MRAPYVNPAGFRFTLYRKGPFSGLGKLLGMRYIATGDFEFDAQFAIKGNDESKVLDLFANPQLRMMFQAQRNIRLEVKDSEGWFGPRFPDDTDELRLLSVGVIKDIDRLKALLGLFTVVLNQLYRIGAAAKQVPEISL